MGEYVWTTAVIGGKITKAQADELATMLTDTFEDVDDIAEAIAKGQSVTAQGSVNYGNPDELRSFLCEHHLPYHISYAGASGVFDAGSYVLLPGGGDEQEWQADDNGEPVATLQELRKWLAEGKSLADCIASMEPATAAGVPPLAWADEPAAEQAEG